MERLLICGSRDWTDGDVIYRLIKQSGAKVVIHGDCRGADKLAGVAAEKLGIPVLPFPADWDKHGKRAGPIRNSQMLKEGKPTLVIALHDNISASRGTKDMVTKANYGGHIVMLMSEAAATRATEDP